MKLHGEPPPPGNVRACTLNGTSPDSSRPSSACNHVPPAVSNHELHSWRPWKSCFSHFSKRTWRMGGFRCGRKARLVELPCGCFCKSGCPYYFGSMLGAPDFWKPPCCCWRLQWIGLSGFEALLGRMLPSVAVSGFCSLAEGRFVQGQLATIRAIKCGLLGRLLGNITPCWGAQAPLGRLIFRD